MSQSTEVTVSTVLALAALGLLALLGLGMVVGRMLRRANTPQGPHTRMPGVLVVDYRYRPAEQRTRSAVIRQDGTAQCLTCAVHIPAPEVTR